MSDASLEEEDSSGELSSLPNIGTAPIPEVEAVLRTADHWHFDCSSSFTFVTTSFTACRVSANSCPSKLGGSAELSVLGPYL